LIFVFVPHKMTGFSTSDSIIFLVRSEPLICSYPIEIPLPGCARQRILFMYLDGEEPYRVR
jgi:hypothetical protein